jgi:hypothetical protein
MPARKTWRYGANITTLTDRNASLVWRTATVAPYFKNSLRGQHEESSPRSGRSCGRGARLSPEVKAQETPKAEEGEADMKANTKALCIKALELLSDATNSNCDRFSDGFTGDRELDKRLRKVSDDLDAIIEDFDE